MPSVKYPLPVRPSRWALMRWMDIPSRVSPGQVYLRRLRVVQTPWFGIYLHRIYEPDTDRFAHDHPWRFWSILLRGHYAEIVYDAPGDWGRSRSWGPGSVHSMQLHQAHRITAASEGLTTLVITGRRVRTWCFWTPDGLVPWNRLEADEGEVT